MNYKNGKIYQIVCNITGEVYIGSCITTLVKRFYHHKHKNNKCSSKQITDRGDCVIILIEEFPCENKDELFQRERYHFDLIPNINKNRPYTTEEECIESHRNQQNIYDSLHIEERKQYRKANVEAIATRNKSYYEINKDSINLRKRESRKAINESNQPS